jgi:glycosyltransferase involved in cell wall biosynthesis
VSSTDQVNAPQISVVMSALNGERFLAEAVGSVLEQSLENFEFIIVDDGSTDSTRDILRGFRDARIHIISNTRTIGLAPSLNRGIQHAKGNYIARLDADDVAEPHRLQRQFEFLERNPEVGLVGSWYYSIDEAGEIDRTVFLPTDYIDLLWAMHFYAPFAHSAIMFRKDAAPRCYDSDLRYSMDFELCLRVARRHAVVNLKEPLVRIRQCSSSMTATFGEATREGRSIRLELVSDLLDWGSLGLLERERRLEAMYKLFRIDQGFEQAKEMVQAVDDVRKLHKAFCSRWRLEDEVATRHRRFVEHWIARKLLRLGKRHLSKGNALGFVQSARLALQLDPLSIATRRLSAAAPFWRI